MPDAAAGLRFHAGAPLMADQGARLGAFCVVRAERLATTTTAEGTETEERLAWLQRNSRTRAKGWLIGRPLESSRILPFLAGRRGSNLSA